MPGELVPEPERVSQLVVIGASAGGIEALLTLVSSLPTDFPAPIVVAQHLDPHRRSQLAGLLAGRTELPVRTVTSDEPLQPGTIYVVPADRDVEISDHHVAVLHPQGPSPKPSVDRLLATAASTFGESLIAVILSGTGSDGALGAQAVKGYGGTVVVQNPETARFPGMPQAVAPAAVDIVADVEAIGPLLMDLLTGEYAFAAPGDADHLLPLLDFIRDQTGLDFAAYKRPTIERRLQRRMTAVGVDTIPGYRRYIDHHPDELQRLAASFLIKVTGFFRDSDLFTYLRERILPELIAEARTRGELRIWSAGCATGEEAFSLAILVAELLGDEVESFPARIFATDIAPDAIDFARHGFYPDAAVEDVPADILTRYFLRVDGGYEVRKLIRALVTFGEHDLGHRAPFPRIDLVLCRNVLIYFTASLQRRALQLFAFSLRRGGYLALGKSETVSPLPEFFALEQPRLKVFRRVGEATPFRAAQVLGGDHLEPASRRGRTPARRPLAAAYTLPEPPSVTTRADRILDEIAVGVVTINRDYDVLAINVAARRLLGIQTPAVGEDLVHRVVPTLREPLRAALDAALRGEATSATYTVPGDPIDAEPRDLLIVATPTGGGPAEGAAEVLVQITDVTLFARGQRELAETRERAEAAVAAVRELRAANQAMASEQGRLRAEVEYLQLAQEEAQAAAEEIETLHEEQQATNEELETVNEELQATIEELQATVGELSSTNEELQSRSTELELMAATVEEQRRAGEAERSRLAAILANMGDAVLVVDAQGEVVLANAAYERLFGATDAFTPADEHGAPLPPEAWPQRRAASGDAFTLPFTAVGSEGERRWFESNGQPIVGANGERWGVIVIRDITDRSLRRLQEQFLAMAAHELRTPLAALSGRLQLLARRLARTVDDERLRQDAALAQEQAHRLDLLIQELLDAARARFGQMALDLAAIDLTHLVRTVADTAQPLAAGQTIHVAVPDHPLTVEADTHRLEQVLLNLLMNAISYAPGTERIDVRVEQQGDEAVIAVQDEGQGIPADILPHIFTRFFHNRQKQTTSGGLGLGLFIAREIVTAHGGTIQATSTVGEGTTFTIRLPLAVSESDLLPSSDPAGSSEATAPEQT